MIEIPDLLSYILMVVALFTIAILLNSPKHLR